MTIIEALADPRVFGGLPAFRNLSTWRRWLVYLTALYGLTLAHLRDVAGIPEAEAERLFCQHTGRSCYVARAGGYFESAAIVGRQGAKTRVASTIVDFEAIQAPPEPDGTETYGVLVAQDQRASLRTLFSYAVAPFDTVPALTRMVPRGWRSMWRRARRSDSLTLSNGCRIAVYPCRPSAVRGVRARVVVCDELAFFRSSEGYPTDTEMLRACRPALATTGGKLIILSSPYGQSGALFALHRKHFGCDASDVLVWQATAPEMNPTLPADYLRRMEADDPDAYRSEVLGEFRSGAGTLLDPETLAACVDAGVRERLPLPGVKYLAFADPASGSGQDAFTVAIAHGQKDHAILDVVRAWVPPFNPSGVIAEAAALLRRYRCSEVTGDQYAPGFVLEACRTHGLTYRPSARDRSALYLDLLPLVNAGRVRLLDDAETLRELRGLERRRGASGRDKVDHRSGAHDDRSNAAAGALTLVGLGRRCVSPFCDDEHCDGDPRRAGLLFTAAADEWLARHPSPEDLAAIEAEMETLAAEEDR